MYFTTKTFAADRRIKAQHRATPGAPAPRLAFPLSGNEVRRIVADLIG